MAEPEYSGRVAVPDSPPAAVLAETTEHQETSGGDNVLQTIDLHSRSQTSDQTPSLQFDGGSGDMKTDSQTSLDEISPIDGTELRRQRASSRYVGPRVCNCTL